MKFLKVIFQVTCLGEVFAQIIMNVDFKLTDLKKSLSHGDYSDILSPFSHTTTQSVTN